MDRYVVAFTDSVDLVAFHLDDVQRALCTTFVVKCKRRAENCIMIVTRKAGNCKTLQLKGHPTSWQLF